MEDSATLVRENWRRATLIALSFVLGLVAIDQIVLFLGNKVARGPYWRDQLLPKMVTTPNVGVYVLGTRRAALTFDSAALHNLTGETFFNAGRVIDGLGNVEFALDVLISQKKTGRAIFVIDTVVLEQTRADSVDDIAKRLMWWQLLDADSQRELKAEYGNSGLSRYSGLWSFRGQSYEFELAFRRWLHGDRSAPPDGFGPRPASWSIIPILRNPEVYRDETQRSFTPSPFAIQKLETLINKASRSGLEPMLVVAPMHRLRATDEVNAQEVRTARALAARTHAPFLSYLDNHGPLANDDELWSDPGHMHEIGAREFSRIFSRDFLSLTQHRSPDLPGMTR